MLKKILFSCLAIFVLIGIFGYLAISPIDKTPYKELACQKETEIALQNLVIQKIATKDNFQAGWAKANITPQEPTHMAGYGFRHEFEGIYDSLFVRTIVFKAQQTQIAFVSIDLLLVHPNVAAAIQKKVKEMMPKIAMIYFTATHTHHGSGGWAKGLIGTVSMGGYEETVFQLLVNQTVKAIALASKNVKPAQIGYGQLLAADYVRHRVLPDEKPSKVDAWLRIVKIRQNMGKEAVIVTYNAHNNGLRHDYKLLSNDYVGGLLDELKGKTDFALFASGMVASHRWEGKGDDYESVRQGGKVLAQRITEILPTIATKEIDKLNYATLPIKLREPQLRIHDDYKLSSWLFEALVGKLDAYITLLQLGDIAFVGMPCDFSGELFADIAPITQAKNITLVITSFNGAYIGYISHDRLYDCQNSEIRDMNWAAPESSAYFTQITRKLLQHCE
jgi:neutral ceramidase